MAELTPQQEESCSNPPADYSDLKAMFLNCTLKKTGNLSHTEHLMDVSMEIIRRNGVGVDYLRPVDFTLPFGVYPDMTEHGWDKDDWPAIQEKGMAADILVVGTPIWLGEESSVCRVAIERLYGNSSILNDAGQYAYYGRTGGCIVTGNEDGVKQCAMTVLYALQHLGYSIPPQADAGWIGGRSGGLLCR